MTNKQKYIRLSYDLCENTPYPEDLWPVEILQERNLQKGDISNVYKMTLCNHAGTHIDGPNHFGKLKKPLNAFDINNFIYHHPVVLDIPKDDNQLVFAEDLMIHTNKIKTCDLLAIRTGFSRIRKTDSRRYAKFSPGFAGSASRYLVDNFDNIKAIAMDTLSFGCAQFPEEGRKAHEIIMEECSRDIFLIEDVNLECDFAKVEKVLAIPLFCEQLDSAQCTVLAQVS